MTDRITFFAPGEPVPQGSKKARVAGKRAVMWEANKRTEPWRRTVAAAAVVAMKGRQPIDSAVEIDLTFRFSRPAAHYLRGRLRSDAPDLKPTTPDVDKLCRAAFDAITGIVVTNDSRVARVSAQKRYVTNEHPEPGMVLTAAVAAGGGAE